MNFEILLLNHKFPKAMIFFFLLVCLIALINWRYFNIIIDNQILRVINHIKYVSKKKPCTLKIFNYQQNYEASHYDYESLENEITELRNNGIIDETFKIINPIEEVLNFPEDDVDIISENSDISCLKTQSSQIDEENEATSSLNNNTLTPNPQAVLPSDIEILFQST